MMVGARVAELATSWAALDTPMRTFGRLDFLSSTRLVSLLDSVSSDTVRFAHDNEFVQVLTRPGIPSEARHMST